MRILTVANQKGGCGKTTTAVNLAACLAAKGQSTLLVDLDPQGHATLAVGVDSAGAGATMFEVLAGSHPLDQAIRNVGERLDLAPADVRLSAVEQILAGVEGREYRFRDAIARLDPKRYAFIVVDTPPNIGLLTFNALVASRELIVPVEGSFLSLHGLAKLVETVEIVSEHTGEPMDVRALATIFDRRTRLAREVLEDLRERFAGRCYHTVIHETVKLREAVGKGRSILGYSPSSIGAEDYLALAGEVLLAETSRDPIRPFRLHETAPGPEVDGHEVRFAVRVPGAQKVEIAGSFTDWKPQPCQASGPVWRRRFSLPAGRHEYRFVVDGRWVEDPGNPLKAADPFGGSNSVVEIPAG